VSVSRNGGLFGLLALCTFWGCKATPSVAGDWSGRVAPAHFDYLELHLTQQGSVIQGTACYEIIPGSTSGGVVFRGAPVTGMYPTLTVVAPSFNDWTFTGSFQDDGTLQGQWHNASVPDYPMSVSRGLPHAPGCLGS
jgi:hypothetical protein